MEERVASFTFLLPFPKQKILDSSKLKEFAVGNFTHDENGRKFFKLEENTVGEKREIACYEQFLLFSQCFQKTCTKHTAPPGWLSGEHVGLMTWWLRVRSPVAATFLSSVFSPLTSAEACEKSSWGLWKEKLC